jgi:hypothetical protein
MRKYPEVSLTSRIIAASLKAIHVKVHIVRATQTDVFPVSTSLSLWGRHHLAVSIPAWWLQGILLGFIA